MDMFRSRISQFLKGDVTVKTIAAITLATALSSVACKPREFNNEAEQKSIASSNGGRIAFAGVHNNDGVGWCYLNEDQQFKPQKIESGLFQSDVTFGETTITVKKYKVDYTLRQYRSAHSSALKQDSLYQFLNHGGIPGRSEAVSTLVNQVLTEVMRTGLAGMSGTLCSEETLNAAGQLDGAIRTAGNNSTAYADLVAQCRNGKPEVVKIPASWVSSSAFQWLVGELKKYSADNTNTIQNLKCPAVMQQIETSLGALVSTKTCPRNEPMCE